jgi:hypothetical protein
MTTTLERLLPEYDQREVHSRWINADPTVVWAGLHEASATDLPLARVLMRLRSAGRTRLNGPLLEVRPALQLLGTIEGHEIVAGLITQAWQLFPHTKKISGGQEAFAAFNEPGWVKVGIDFRLIPERGAPDSAPKPAARPPMAGPVPRSGCTGCSSGPEAASSAVKHSPRSAVTPSRRAEDYRIAARGSTIGSVTISARICQPIPTRCRRVRWAAKMKMTCSSVRVRGL